MNKYEQQANKFLIDTGTTFEIEFQYTGPYFPGGKEYRDVWRFILKNAMGEYSSTFGDSLAATRARAPLSYLLNPSIKKDAAILAERKKYRNYRPSAYAILACLEKYEPDSFDNWCADTGYNERSLSEYPAVMQTYQACVDQYRGLRRMFTEEQMEQLQDIS